MLSAPVLVLALALAGQAEGEAERVLLEAAAGARAAGDRARTTEYLLGWASLARTREPPPGFEREMAALAVPAAEQGPYRLFGSRLDDRVRVGLNDPAHLTGRIDVRWVLGDRTLYLRPLDSHAAGRLEYGGAGPIPHDAEIVIEAWMTRFGDDVLLRRTLIAPEVAAPPPPAPAVPVAAAPDAAPAAEESLSWIWIGAGIVAAALAGAAIWQETRF